MNPVGPVAWVLGSLVPALASLLPWGVGWALGSHIPAPASYGRSRYSLLILSFSLPVSPFPFLPCQLGRLWLKTLSKDLDVLGFPRQVPSETLSCAEGSEHENLEGDWASLGGNRSCPWAQ